MKEKANRQELLSTGRLYDHHSRNEASRVKGRVAVSYNNLKDGRRSHFLSATYLSKLLTV